MKFKDVYKILGEDEIINLVKRGFNSEREILRYYRHANNIESRDFLTGEYPKGTKRVRIRRLTKERELQLKKQQIINAIKYMLAQRFN